MEVKLTRLEAIDLRRKRLGLNKTQVAEEAGLHAGYVRSLMRGSVISPPGLDKIEDALNRLEAEAKRAA